MENRDLCFRMGILSKGVFKVEQDAQSKVKGWRYQSRAATALQEAGRGGGTGGTGAELPLWGPLEV